MFVLLLTSIITCKQAYGLIEKIKSNRSLSEFIKTELIEELRQTIPSCPVIVKSDER